MSNAKRSRRNAAIAFSVAAHAVVLTVLALHAPVLRMPPGGAGPPEPVIPILIMPRLPPPAPGRPREPIRLHRRRQREPLPGILPLPPLVAPEVKPSDVAAQAPRPRPAAPAPLPGAAVASLRHSLGCGNPEAFHLSREEQAGCEQSLGVGARTAAFRGLGIDAGKAAALDRTGAAERRYRDTPPPVGVRPGPPGASAAGMGAMLGVDKPAARAPF
jgi:hypothetical protein